MRLIISFIATALLLFATVTLDQNRLPAGGEESRREKIAEEVIETKGITKATSESEAPSDLIDEDTRKAVEAYFEDDPLLVHIAFCESTFRQNGKNGEVLRGKTITQDVGVMQINERFHAAQAEKLGYDIYTLEGNLGYAKWLYEKEGARPWMSSSKCWIARSNQELAFR